MNHQFIKKYEITYVTTQGRTQKFLKGGFEFFEKQPVPNCG